MKKEKVLIVEDEKLLLDLLAKKLGSEGYIVETAGDGQEGMEKIRAGNYDFILLDMMLPRMDGYDILENMKKEKISTAVMIISNSGQPVDIKRAFDLGVCDYLVKSRFEPEEVMAKMNHCISTCQGCKKNPKGKKIMLVEDDKFLRDLCVKKLLIKGYMVDIAMDGDEAYEKIRCKKPDLVLLDIIMPGLSGFDVLKKIRASQDPGIAGLPVIMLSNLGQDNDLKKAKELGANDFLIKADFDINDIDVVIQKFLK
jgi:DNA-binding response OmpR family regulator